MEKNLSYETGAQMGRLMKRKPEVENLTPLSLSVKIKENALCSFGRQWANFLLFFFFAAMFASIKRKTERQSGTAGSGGPCCQRWPLWPAEAPVSRRPTFIGHIKAIKLPKITRMGPNFLETSL
jgi:hypothetical protein